MFVVNVPDHLIRLDQLVLHKQVNRHIFVQRHAPADVRDERAHFELFRDQVLDLPLVAHFPLRTPNVPKQLYGLPMRMRPHRPEAGSGESEIQNGSEEESVTLVRGILGLRVDMSTGMRPEWRLWNFLNCSRRCSSGFSLNLLTCSALFISFIIFEEEI